MLNDTEVITFPIGNLQCNCSIIYSRATRRGIAIDPGDDAEMFLTKVGELEIDLIAVLHTHAHFDHCGQSGLVKKALGTPLYLHDDDLFLYRALPEQGRFFGARIAPPEPLDGSINHDQIWEIPISETGHAKLRTIHTPGHTPGSCSFYLETSNEPILFTGDTLFERSIGRTDLPGGDHDQILMSIRDRILPLPGETRCITGHGRETHLHVEARQNPFLQ